MKAEGSIDQVIGLNPTTGELRLRMPVKGDLFVPLHGYEALMRIPLSILPLAVLQHFTEALGCLRDREAPPPRGTMMVGVSFSHVGNEPPTQAGALWRVRRKRGSKTGMPDWICARPGALAIGEANGSHQKGNATRGGTPGPVKTADGQITGVRVEKLVRAGTTTIWRLRRVKGWAVVSR